MNNSKFMFIVLCTCCVALSVQTEFLKNDHNRGSVMRQKKRIVIRKPYRSGERLHGRQSSNFQHSSISSVDEYSFVVTSESPSVAWKPITYSSFPQDGFKSIEYKPSEVNALPNGKVGHIYHNQQALNAYRDSSESMNTEHYHDYALLHYYIPFQHIMVTNAKPIKEPLQESPKKPIPFEQIMKAAIEPVAKFTTSTSPTTSTTTTAPDHSHIESKDPEFTGRYEYEYFVQDNHWGTNFGHKEYRDGKYTKGDYEVVLPDNRVQHVRYWSDASGYHAQVTYHPLNKKSKHAKA